MNTGIRDQINSLNADATARIAFHIISSIQGTPTGHQIRGIAMAFFMMCERFNADPIHVLDVTRRATKDAFSQGRGEHVRAVQNYLKGELK